MIDRRSLLAGLGAAFLSKAAKADAPISEQAKLVAGLMAPRKNFFMLDKKRGEIIVFENNSPIFKTSALFGKGAGDSVDIPNATPAGEFETHIIPGAFESRYEIAFLRLPNPDPRYYDSQYVIHPTPVNLKNIRDPKYKTPDPKDNMATGGCVNLPLSQYFEIEEFLIRHQKSVRAADGSTKIVNPPFIVLPQRADLSQTQAFFGLPGPSFPGKTAGFTP